MVLVAAQDGADERRLPRYQRRVRQLRVARGAVVQLRGQGVRVPRLLHATHERPRQHREQPHARAAPNRAAGGKGGRELQRCVRLQVQLRVALRRVAHVHAQRARVGAQGVQQQHQCVRTAFRAGTQVRHAQHARLHGGIERQRRNAQLRQHGM